MITATEKYQRLRSEARNQTYLDIIESLPELTDRLRLTDISQDAIQAQLSWPIHQDPERVIGWVWSDVVRQYRRNHKARIELAIWYADLLCGLMLGKASQGKLVVKINYLHGLPGDHPLKGVVLPVATRCAELFAAAINAPWVGIQEPLEQDGLIDYYEQLGFDQPEPFDHRNRAIFKRIDN